MDTANDSRPEVAERTMPEEIADLDVEVQAMYDRVRTRLGLESSHREVIDRYELRGPKIGAGGMGSVYRAYDAELEREVAIKVVSTRSLTNIQKLRERLSREAKVLAKLVHPNVVTVHDAGVDRGRVFLVMELITGETLRERQERGGCSMRECLRSYVEAGKGLAAAHARGIIHRDFKPDNVFVSGDGHVKVGDFGLAYVLGDHEPDSPSSEGGRSSSERMTQTGEFLGTLGYMAPEQLRGERPDARSDQYAFFASLWESLCGERPYIGNSREEILDAIENRKPHASTQLPMRLRRMLTAGLAPRRELRYPDMHTVVNMLEHELERPGRVRRRLAWSVASVATLAGIGALWFAYATTRPRCELANRIAAQASTEAWSEFASTMPDEMATRSEWQIEELERAARDVCEVENPAQEQQLQGMLRRLEHLDKQTPENFANALDIALASGPTQPVTSPVEQFIAEHVEPWERAGTTGPRADQASVDERIIESCTKGLEEIARTRPDLAELLLRRGRAYSRHGDYDLALADFRAARGLAEHPPDPERRLQANVEAGKTTAMRTENLVLASEFLSKARDIIAAVRESPLGPRRADLDEVSASLARRQGDTSAALRSQWSAVLRHSLAGRRFKQVPALVNLGIIYEVRHEFDVAENCYQTALQIDPHDLEALVNLGRLLVNELEHFNQPGEARELLREVVQSDYPDTRLHAANLLLQLELMLGNVSDLDRPRRELLALLESEHPGTPSHQREGWSLVVLSYAMEGDFGGEFEASLAKLPAPQNEGELLYRAWLEFDIANSAIPAHPDIAVRFLNAASQRLDRVTDEERDELITELQNARLSLEHHDSP